MKTKTNKGKTTPKPKSFRLVLGITALIALLIASYMGINYLMQVSQPETPEVVEVAEPDVLGSSTGSYSLDVCYEGTLGKKATSARFGYEATNLSPGNVQTNYVSNGGALPQGLSLGSSTAKQWSTNSYTLGNKEFKWYVKIDGKRKNVTIEKKNDKDTKVTQDNQCPSAPVEDNNPELPEACGLDIALVLDSSDSISNDEIDDIKQAANGFVNSLDGTPTKFAVVDFDSAIVSELALTDDYDAVHDAINSIGHTRETEYTNWDAGLHHGRTLLDAGSASKPNLLVIITDGDTTTWGNDSNQGSYNYGGEPDAIDMEKAIEEAEAAKADGTRILAIGVSSSPTLANLKAISGPDVNTGFPGVDVITTDFDELLEDLAELASELCGGTISVNKYIGSVDPENRAGTGWEFTVAGQQDVPTDENGQTAAIEVQPGTYSVIETLIPDGYTYDSATCYNGDQEVGQSTANGVQGIQVGSTDIISCDFVNNEEEELTGSITVCKVVTDEEGNIVDGAAHAGTTFTIPGVTSPSGYTHAGIIPDSDFTLPLTFNADLIDGGSSMSKTPTPPSPVPDCRDPNDPNPQLTKNYISYMLGFEGGEQRSDSQESKDVDVTVDNHDMTLHMSCSDSFLGPDETEGTADDGYGEKGDPTEADGDPRVTSYKVWSYKIDSNKGTCELHKECGEVPSYDAECTTYDDLSLGGYFYGEETSDGNGDDWSEPLYNDQDETDLQTLSDFFPYSGELFTPSTGDDAGRNTDSDGHITLTEERPDRTIVVLNGMSEEAAVDLSVSKTDSMVTAVPGTEHTYYITVTNNGPGDATGATVTDTLPPELSGVTWTCSETGAASCTSSGNGSINDTVDVPMGDSVTYTVTSTILPGATGTLSNTVTVDPPQGITDTNTENNTDTDTSELTPRTDLAVTKIDDPDPVVAGEQLTYTMEVTNNGPSAATGVTLSDTAPSELTNVAIVQGPSCDTSISCTIGNMDPGTSTTVIVTADVLSSVIPGSSIENTVIVTGNETDPDQLDNTFIQYTAVEGEAKLSITKTDNKTTAVPGEENTYTITIANAGPSDVVDAIMNDTFPVVFETPEWTCISVPGSTCTGVGSGDINDSVTIIAGDSITYTVSGTISSGALGTLTNTATATLPEGVIDPTDSSIREVSATDNTDLNPSADVAVTKMGSPDPVTAGSTLSYTVSITNNGPSDAENVIVTDTLPSEVSIVSINSTQGTCTNAISCNLGTVVAGDTVNILINTKVHSDVQPGTITNTASASASTYDPDLSNNNGTTSTETTEVTTVADLSIEKTDDPAEVIAGENLTYTLTVTNGGPSDAQDVVITDQIPANTVYVDELSSVECDEDSPGIVTCNLGTISAEGVGIATIVVIPMTDGETVGKVTIRNNASVNSSTTDDDPSDNSTYEDTDVLPSADLKVTKNAKDTVFAGRDLKYVITVKNKGPSATNDIIVEDTLPPEVTFISATPQNGTCNYVSPVITCSGFDTLNNGEKVKITVWVNVPSSTSGDAVLDNGVTVHAEETHDPNESNNTFNALTEVNLSTNLKVQKVDLEDPVKAGTNVSYTLTVENLGPSDATGVTFEDNLPTETSFVSATTGCDGATDPGKVTCIIGNLAAGATTDVDIVALVSSDTADESKIKNEVDVYGDQNDPRTGNNHAQEKTTIETEADISVTKTAAPEPVTAGNNLTYMIAVTNNGPSDAQSVKMSDPIPSEVTFESVSTSGQGDSCSEIGGTVECDLGTIANGATKNVMVIVKVPPSTQLGTEITNVASAESEVTTDPDTSNNSGEASTTTTEVDTEADVSIIKTDGLYVEETEDVEGLSNGGGLGTVYAGQMFTYTLTVYNGGPSDATHVNVSDLLPDSVTYEGSRVDPLQEGRSCIESQGVVDCTLGTVPAEGTVTIEIDVTPQEEGQICNASTVSSETRDELTDNNTSSICSIVEPSADLEITKSAAPDLIMLGLAKITYNIDVTNHGPSIATGVVVTDELPANSTLSLASASQGTCSGTTTITCELGTMDVQGHASIIVVVTPGVKGLQTNRVNVTNTSEIYDPNLENNYAEAVSDVYEHTGGGPTPGPGPTPDPEEPHLSAPEPMEKKYCLTYNPDRNLRFIDLERGYNLAPDPMSEATIPLTQKAINILKNSYIANILMQTDAQQVSDLFTFSDGLQYVVSGYKYSTTVGTPTVKGTTAYIALDGTMNRLEMVKVFMLSHCYPVLNSLELKDGPRFYADKNHPNQEIMHEWIDLPNIEFDDPELNYARDVAYSAQYWWIWDGFWNETTQLYDTVRISDPVTIAQGIKMNDRLGQLVRGETVFTRDSKLEDLWYLTYYINAAEELGHALSVRILDRGRANDPLSRGEAAYELINIMIERELYSPEELQKIVDTYTTENDEGLISLLGLKAT